MKNIQQVFYLYHYHLIVSHFYHYLIFRMLLSIWNHHFFTPLCIRCRISSTFICTATRCQTKQHHYGQNYKTVYLFILTMPFPLYHHALFYVLQPSLRTTPQYSDRSVRRMNFAAYQVSQSYPYLLWKV